MRTVILAHLSPVPLRPLIPQFPPPFLQSRSNSPLSVYENYYMHIIIFSRTINELTEKLNRIMEPHQCPIDYFSNPKYALQQPIDLSVEKNAALFPDLDYSTKEGKLLKLTLGARPYSN